MKNLVKAGVGAALALGAVAAHASITVPTSSNTADTAVLFVDVFTGTTLDKAYVGDTNIQVSSIVAGTLPSTFSDANLQTLLTTYANQPGTTTYWALEGANNYGNAPQLITSSASKPAVVGSTGNGLFTAGVSFHGEINGVNGLINGSPTSVLLDSDAQLTGSGFNPLALAGDVANWYGNTGQITTTGLGTQSVIYSMTATDTQNITAGVLTAVFNAALTSSGLTFTPISAVPIPAALWLLGSGLLGLLGVARRRVGVA
ncbi:MAG TPA: hypothetical protein VMU44_10770 [Steroidobacteraceae bacterium]|nr:hypothetical protein [Steroidobacteraceae bacterium]